MLHARCDVLRVVEVGGAVEGAEWEGCRANAMKVLINDNRYGKLIPGTEKPKKRTALIKKALWVRGKNYWFSKQFKARVWDGYFKFYHKGYDTFPLGLLDRLQEAATEMGLPLHVRDLREETLPNPERVDSSYLQGIQLKDFQMDAIQKMLGKRRGIINSATNSGKTEMACATIKATDGITDGNTLWVTHRLDLLRQTVDRIVKRTALDVGVFGGGVFDPKKVTVSTSQTLLKNKEIAGELITDASVLIMDECHNLTAKLYKLLMKSNAPFRWALSGTPNKGDPVAYTRILALFGEEIVTIRNRQLIEEKFSVVPTVYIVDYHDPLREDYDGGANEDDDEFSFPNIYDEAVVYLEHRHRFIVDLVNSLEKEDRPVLVIVSRVVHGKALHRIFEECTTLKTSFSSGATKSRDRQGLLALLRTRWLDVGIATIIFDEGVDIPDLRTIVLAAPSRSRRQLLQRIGRGLRTAPEKHGVKIFDILDHTSDYFLYQGLARIKEYREEGFRVEKFFFKNEK